MYLALKRQHSETLSSSSCQPHSKDDLSVNPIGFHLLSNPLFDFDDHDVKGLNASKVRAFDSASEEHVSRLERCPDIEGSDISINI